MSEKRFLDGGFLLIQCILLVLSTSSKILLVRFYRCKRSIVAFTQVILLLALSTNLAPNLKVPAVAGTLVDRQRTDKNKAEKWPAKLSRTFRTHF